MCFSSLLFSNNTQYTIVEKAIEKNLYNSHVWHRLLHLDSKDNPSISSPSFILSHENFTPKNELIKTINSFFEDNQSMCKFPARYFWIKQELSLSDLDFPSKTCVGFDDYLNKIGAKDLKLVFVSEQVSNPSSMMGHTFFKLEGIDKNKKSIQHAVSLFTVIDTYNIPHLLLKSTVTGMKGFFTLSPYKTQVNRYLNTEERNVWEYELNLSKFQKELIYYHFWELKEVDITYLFTGFNCATIIEDMLGIADKDYKNDSSLWVTPKDAIKKANSYNLIKKTIMMPSSVWELNMLCESLPVDKTESIQNIVFNKQLEKLESFHYSDDINTKQLEVELMGTYANYLGNNSNIFDVDDVSSVNEIIKTHNNDYSIDLSKYKNPLNTSNDSQISISYQNANHQRDMKINILPASNTLYDDNREYFSESSLSIGEFSLLVNKDKVYIDTINLFAMKSLIPWNSLTKDLSSDFKFSYEKQYTNNLNEFHAVNISGGFGVSKKIGNDIYIFGLMDIGLAYGNKTLYPYCFPQLGLMIYELFNMKSTLEYKYLYNQDDSHSGYHDFNFEQSLFVDKKYRIGASYNHKQSSSLDFDTFGVSFNYYF